MHLYFASLVLGPMEGRSSNRNPEHAVIKRADERVMWVFCSMGAAKSTLLGPVTRDLGAFTFLEAVGVEGGSSC